MKMTPKPNFTPRAQQAISEAKRVATKFGNEFISLEHLFYGMVNLNAGILSEILFLLQIDQDLLKEEIEKTFYIVESDSTQAFIPEDFHAEYDEHFHLVLKVAASISDKLGHEYVGVRTHVASFIKV